jgi:hypothetical protein
MAAMTPTIKEEIMIVGTFQCIRGNFARGVTRSRDCHGDDEDDDTVEAPAFALRPLLR